MVSSAALGIALLIALVSIVGLGLLYLRHQKLTRRFASVINVEADVSKAQKELRRVLEESSVAKAAAEKQRQSLGEEYAAAKATYDRLKQELALLEENVEDISFGVYKPHFDFDSSEKYKRELETLRGEQKALIKDGRAATCSVTWEVKGSKAEGARMQKQYLKLMLRAFNGECDAAIAKVSWNTVTRMEERIKKAYEAINTLGGVMSMVITDEYRNSKLKELQLEYECEEKKHREQEEQRRIREQMREEEKALREAEKAKQEAEAEEVRYQKALESARDEMARAKGAALDELQSKIQQLGQALQRAREMKEKATTMAQLTKSGHVYIISNVGSFGESVYKIGMTRRLEPMDRVKELSDASVPFEFDVHAMVYSENAPSLEAAFHEAFDDRRINLINPRKEFFNVSIDDVEEFTKRQNLNIELTKIAEAKEYRQSLAQREAAAQQKTQDTVKATSFPDQL